MPHETMTNRQILEAEAALKALKGWKKRQPAKKVARTLRWVMDKADEFRDARKLLVEGHAERDDEGRKVPMRVKHPETGEFRDVPESFIPEDQAAWDEEINALLDDSVNMSGDKITDDDLNGMKEVPDPEIIAGLGPLYQWDDEEDEE